MMTMKLSTVGCFVGAFFIFYLTANSAWASKQEQHPCDPSRENVGASISRLNCEHYVLGFMEGAIVTDTAIIERLEEKEERSNFLKRVYKTRSYGSPKSIPSTYLAKFCLPEPLDKKAVVNKIMDGLVVQKNKGESADSRIYEAFKTAYPCD